MNYSFRHKSYYSKATKLHSAGDVREPKQYEYIPDLILEVINKRELAEESLDAKPKVRPDDPRNLQPTIAAVPKPPMKDLVAGRQKYTRFGHTSAAQM